MREFEFIAPMRRPVNAYGHENVMRGDVIKLNGHLAEKCANNPDFKEVTGMERPKLKPGPKPKAKLEDVNGDGE